MKNILELITNATSLQQNIVSACSSISICANCILRYLGIRSLDLHLKVMNENPFRIRHQQASGHELRPKGVNLIATKENHDSNTEAKLLCPSCLGLFQLDFKSLSLDAVKLMRMENYILKEQTFCVAIKLPPQLIIRHQAVIHYIQRHLTADESFDFPDYIEVKEVFKYLVRDSFAKESNLSYATESPFAFTIYVDHSQTDEDYLFLTKIPEAKFDAKASKKRGRTVHKGASQDKIAKAVALVSSEQYFEYQQCPPPAIQSYPEIAEMFFMHSQLYVAGRYCKLKRHISNSRWVVKGKRLADDSVEELIAEFLTPQFKNSSYKFSSSGREDSDVLMLGRGRPFYFELTNPRKADFSQAELTELQKKINDNVDGKIRVNDLQICSKESTLLLRNSAATKCKSYVCIVELRESVPLHRTENLSKQKDIKLEQRNPTRVPRRADLVRDKIIHELCIIPVIYDTDGLVKRVKIDLKTSAGTYVKEFMHGDDGRTIPNLHTLLDCKGADVISLDVMKVFLDWPPEIN